MKETTPFQPRSPYAAAKLYAYWITVNYREAYGFYACNGILFNHEGPTRGETFVTRKITRAVAAIKLGRQKRLFIGNLDAKRDWATRGSHVAAAMQVKVHRAKETGAKTIEICGSGTPRREFLYVDDLADALVFLMQRYSGEPHINVGTGVDITIRELAELVAKVADWQGEFVYDPNKPDGMPRKVMDVSKLEALGWEASTPLEDGFRIAYQWYAENVAEHSVRRARCAARAIDQTAWRRRRSARRSLWPVKRGVN